MQYRTTLTDGARSQMYARLMGAATISKVAKTPVRPEATYAVRAFVRVESTCSKCMAQCPAQDVHHSE
jgi:hypothetical protein